MALHDAGEALALRDRSDVGLLPLFEHIGNVQHLPWGVVLRIVDPDLDEVTMGRHAGPSVMTSHWPTSFSCCELFEGDLYRAVPVSRKCLHLDDVDRPGLDDGDRDRPGLLIEDLRHAELFAHDGIHVLISTSTPAGRSRRINESTVFAVGSRMSIRRL